MNPTAAFLAAWRAAPPDALDAAKLEDLVMMFATAAMSDDLPPPGAPSLDVAADAMRNSVRTKLAPWLPYFEYHAAWAACQHGDLARMRLAVDRLGALDLVDPPITDNALQRGVLRADLLRVLGEYGPAAAEVDRLLGMPTDRQILLCTMPEDDASAKRSALAGVLSDLYGLRGEICRDVGQLEEAAAALRQSIELAQATGDTTTIRRALLRDLGLSLVTGRIARGLAVIEAQLATPDLDRGLRATLLVCRGYAESGVAGTDPEAIRKALRTLDEARPDCQGHLLLRADLKRLDLALRAADGAAAERVLAECRATVGVDAIQNLTPDACELVGANTRLLLLRGASPAALAADRQAQQAAVRQLASQWRSQPAQLLGIGFLHQRQRRELIGEGLALELALAKAEGRDDGPAHAVQTLLDLQACTSLARARHAPRCDLATVQANLLNRNHAVLVYLPARRATWAFLIEPTTTTAHELAGDIPANEFLALLLSRLSHSPRVAGEERENVIAQLDEASRRAFDLLLPGELGKRVASLQALTVVGADLLGGVPFEALQTPDGRLLGEMLAVDSTASLPFTTALAEAAKPVARTAAKVLVLGCTRPAASTEAGSVEGFDFPKAELQQGLAGYERPQILVDPEVTRTVLLAPSMGQTDIVHLVLHQAANQRHLDRGFVVHDGVVWRQDLTGHEARGLVIVSSCGGGEGPGRLGEGDGFASLAGAFLWNGAQAVIASRNELLALDHLRDMARCHRALANGASPARAMQLARSEAAANSDLLARAQRALVQVFGAGQVPLLRP